MNFGGTRISSTIIATAIPVGRVDAREVEHPEREHVLGRGGARTMTADGIELALAHGEPCEDARGQSDGNDAYELDVRLGGERVGSATSMSPDSAHALPRRHRRPDDASRRATTESWCAPPRATASTPSASCGCTNASAPQCRRPRLTVEGVCGSYAASFREEACRLGACPGPPAGSFGVCAPVAQSVEQRIRNA